MKKILFLSLMLGSLCGYGHAQSTLTRFNNYPDEAKPRTWWHWMYGSISREGITHDLEKMKEAGLGGCYIFNVSDKMPAGPVKMLSKEWYDLTLFAIKESDRLGLKFGMHNCPGWSSSGGPWNDQASAMQKLIFSQATAAGGVVDITIPKGTKQDYYRDVCVLAFPTLKGDENGKGYRFHNWEEKSGVVQKVTGEHFTAAQPTDAGNIVKKEAIIDVSSFMDDNGRLQWKAPAGNWTIIRFGHTYINKENHPAPPEATGLEVDKFNPDAVKHHFDSYCGKIIKMARQYAGKTFTTITIDSYEMGIQNWTGAFPKEFAKRMGYDIKPYLVAMTGRVVGSPEETERFLWDFRKTINDLFVDNYYKRMRELINAEGIQLAVEPYGNINVSHFDIASVPDVPMSEFWANGTPGANLAMVSSIGRIYGKNIIDCESFTSFPKDGVWYQHPHSLKRGGDIAYIHGVSRYVFHSWPHQPRPDITPGVTMGPHGVFFASSNTWVLPGKAWFEYHSRCQSLLQAGLYSADVLYFVGEDAPLNTGTALKRISATLGKGYLFDYCNTDAFLNRTAVRDGKITLPDGLSYNLLVLPEDVAMSPAVARKIKELVEAGARVLGPRPTLAKGLNGYPTSDKTVEEIGRQVWGAASGASGEKSYGKGKVYWGVDANAILASMGKGADFSFSRISGKPDLNFIHRQTDDAQYYFVANAAQAGKVICTFRAGNKSPELWDPTSGTAIKPAIYSRNGETVSVPLEFDTYQSVFVVFRSEDRSDPVRDVVSNGVSLVDQGIAGVGFPDFQFDGEKLVVCSAVKGKLEIERASGKKNVVEMSSSAPIDISSKWQVWFDPTMGGPGQTTFPSTVSWTDNAVDGIKYYSGTARYRKEVDIPASAPGNGKRIFLEFEKIADLGKISVNGQKCGTLWTPPYRMEITKHVKSGKNVIEIEATNTWNNRMIGDERYAPDAEYYDPVGSKFAGTFGLKQWPEWFFSGKPRPASKRIAFATWRVYKPDSPLHDAGIIGKVSIVPYGQKEL
ncbi:hypothetical protein FACS1894159_04610 [Bacteroidia bacterium]|nr:hypothetical protein FACS1894159_04610 [Bacteroidia bacterium]